MKSVFALIAAVAIIASAQVSFAANCAAGDKSGRGKLMEPTTKATSTVKSVKTVR